MKINYTEYLKTIKDTASFVGVFIIPAVVVSGIFAVYASSSFEERKIQLRKDKGHYEESLECAGLSLEKVLLQKSNPRLDVNRDGVRDYRVLIPEGNGIYESRYVLGSALE